MKNMVNKLIRICGMLLLIGALVPMHVKAQGDAYIDDQAGFFSDEEFEELGNLMVEKSEAYDIDMVVLTMSSPEIRDEVEYTDLYYDDSGFANDGILFYIDTYNKKVYINTKGSVYEALSSSDIDSIIDSGYEDLKAGDYEAGFYSMVSKASELYGREGGVTAGILISLIVGLIAAGITAFILCMIHNMNNAKPSVSTYGKDGAFKIVDRKDTYITSQTNVIKDFYKPKESEQGRGGGHTASNGQVHGGGGRDL